MTEPKDLYPSPSVRRELSLDDLARLRGHLIDGKWGTCSDEEIDTLLRMAEEALETRTTHQECGCRTTQLRDRIEYTQCSGHADELRALLGGRRPLILAVEPEPHPNRPTEMETFRLLDRLYEESQPGPRRYLFLAEDYERWLFRMGASAVRNEVRVECRDRMKEVSKAAERWYAETLAAEMGKPPTEPEKGPQP